MPSEVDWEAHETHQLDTASLKLIGEIMIQPFTLWMDAYSLKLIGEPMIQVYSFILCTLIMMRSQRISSLKDCGEDYHKEHLPPLSWSTSEILLILDKLKMDFLTPTQSSDIEVHTLFLILNNMKLATIYFLNGILGETFATSTLQERKHK